MLFGTTGTAQALGPDGVSPVGVGAGRIVLGGLLLVLIAIASGELRDRRRWPWPTVLLAGLAVAGYQVSFFAGVDRAGVAVGTVVTIGSAPAFTGLLGWLAGQGRPDPAWTAATGLAVVGVLLLATSGAVGEEVDPWGLPLALTSGALYAVYTVAAKRLLDAGHRPVGVMGMAFGVGGLLLVPLLPLLAPAAGRDPVPVLILVVYLAVIPTAAAYVLFARGLQRLPASTVATLTLTEPVVAAALGVLVLTEPVTAGRAVGAGLILAGLSVLAVTTGRGRAGLAGASR